jgi:pectate lyase
MRRLTHRLGQRRHYAARARVTAAITVPLLAAAGLVAASVVSGSASTAGCQVAYSVGSQWPGGFSASVNITNLGDAINGWTLTWDFPAGQQVTQGWNGNFSQSGSRVTVTNASYNGALATNATTSIGFNGSFTGSANPSPTDFALNGVACNGTTSGGGTPTPTPTPTPTSGLVGFAAISGDGHGPVAGGSGGPTVTVTSLSQLETAAASSGPETIRVSGLFTGSGEVTVTSDKSIIGVGSGSGLTGIGLSVKGQHNVIIQNMNISKVTAASGDGDAIHIETSDHIWVDHNNLSSDMNNGKDFYDGLIDITHAGDYVTVSWNYIHDHYKVSLVGHSDSNGAEDTGHLKVTYHHNYFRNFDSRTPSLRFGTGHVFDNYFVNGSTGVDSRMGAQMLVQNNVFSNVKTPIMTCCLSSQDGFVNQSGNDFGGGVNNITQTGTFTNPPYSYTLDPTSSVVSLVTAGAGTGKIGA